MSYLWDLEEHIVQGKILKSSYWGQATTGWLGPFFIWGVDSETSSKDFHLAIEGGLGWMKWLKNGAEKAFIFHVIFPALYPFWQKIYCLS